jgi:hypothetical protein
MGILYLSHTPLHHRQFPNAEMENFLSSRILPRPPHPIPTHNPASKPTKSKAEKKDAHNKAIRSLDQNAMTSYLRGNQVGILDCSASLGSCVLIGPSSTRLSARNTWRIEADATRPPSLDGKEATSSTEFASPCAAVRVRRQN